MKYVILSFFRRCIAAITSFFMVIGGGGSALPEIPEADPNTVSAYNAEEADYSLGIDAGEEVHDISDLLFGIFFEDINFAADGGLYAEMVANRSFEFTPLAAGDQLYHYSSVNNAVLDVKIDDAQNGLNMNNRNYLVVSNPLGGLAGVQNMGFMEGMAIEEKAYTFSVYAKALNGYDGGVTVRLVAGDETAAEGVIEKITNEWTKYTLTLESKIKADKDVYIQVLINEGVAAFDMISLFPEDTYHGRENGLRNDLAKKLEELQPKFLRFPGGCVIEGYNIPTAYRWKDSIGVDKDGQPLLFNDTYGDVAARSQGENIWTDHSATDDPWPCFMTYGLGFYEFFVLCEDLGASPVPVLSCGLYCQMRGMHGEDMNSADFAAFMQDMLDLVEFCRGDETTVWGKVRIAMGHEDPFEIQYIGIGNENEGEEYFERYQAFLDKFNEARLADPELYDGIELIYSAGASDALNGGNHKKAYEYAEEHIENGNVTAFAGAIDEHYYQTPEWFLKNADYYDENNYRRSADELTATVYGGAIPVFLGEYAARSNRLEAALAEAAYMTGLERNGDIVRMAAYAPLFASATASHWSPNLIWFNNSGVTTSVNYYVQKLFANNQGTKLLKSSLNGAAVEQQDLQGRVGVGTWYTEAEFDNLLVVDNETGKTLIKDDFSIPNFFWNWQNVNKGNFKIKGGKLIHEGTDMRYSDIGDVAYIGVNNDMKNYTFTVEATKTDGEEGFLIPFAVQDADNNYFWNIGGWGNTVSCLQNMSGGIKTGQILKTVSDFRVETGKTYLIKIVVNGSAVQGYIDGELMFDYDTASPAEAEAYCVVSTDDRGDIIVKIVNVTERVKTVAVSIENAEVADSASVQQLKGENLTDENVFGEEETCSIEEFTLSGISEQFNYAVPAYSVTVLRIPQK
ncbi:MAG: hypothetical protein J1E34_00345 [Oscillospiraceae bacterium]|nr:hypothetical protein [Oscillospiraceae bacterium]